MVVGIRSFGSSAGGVGILSASLGDCRSPNSKVISSVGSGVDESSDSPFTGSFSVSWLLLYRDATLSSLFDSDSSVANAAASPSPLASVCSIASTACRLVMLLPSSGNCRHRNCSASSATLRRVLENDRSCRISSAACCKASRQYCCSAYCLPRSVMWSPFGLDIHPPVVLCTLQE